MRCLRYAIQNQNLFSSRRGNTFLVEFLQLPQRGYVVRTRLAERFVRIGGINLVVDCRRQIGLGFSQIFFRMRNFIDQFYTCRGAFSGEVTATPSLGASTVKEATKKLRNTMNKNNASGDT